MTRAYEKWVEEATKNIQRKMFEWYQTPRKGWTGLRKSEKRVTDNETF